MPNIEYMTKTDRVLHSIKRALWWLIAATLVLVIALAGVSVYSYINAAQSRDDAAKANSALCALRHDLKRRVVIAQQFQTDHPKGAFGFSPAQIQKGINDQSSTILTLSNLNC